MYILGKPEYKFLIILFLELINKIIRNLHYCTEQNKHT